MLSAKDNKPFMPLTITPFKDGSYEIQTGPYKKTLTPNEDGEFNLLDFDSWVTELMRKEAEKYQLRRRLMGR